MRIQNIEMRLHNSRLFKHEKPLLLFLHGSLNNTSPIAQNPWFCLFDIDTDNKKPCPWAKKKMQQDRYHHTFWGLNWLKNLWTPTCAWKTKNKMATIHGLFLKFTKKERLSSHFLRVHVFLSFFFFLFQIWKKENGCQQCPVFNA